MPNINARHLCVRKESADLDMIDIHRDSGHSPLASSEQPFWQGDPSNLPNQTRETCMFILLQATHC